MNGTQPTVFISYSHKDEVWKDRLLGHLRILEFEGELEVWDDRRIGAGDDWRPEIEQAIERATLAILIVSKNFLTSRFIREQELTRILSRRSRKELHVIPLIAEPCAWQAVSSLQGIQARPKDGHPLSAGSEHQIDAALAALALEILDGPGPSGPVRDGPFRPRLPLPSSVRSLAWLLAPTAALVLFTAGASYWRLETRVSVDVVTRRASFVVRGERPQSVLNQSAEFSELTIERCGTVSFSAARIDLVEPPAIGNPLKRSSYSGPVRFLCDDPGAKITLADAGDSGSFIGVLDRVMARPGATVIVEVSGETVPVVTLDVSTRQDLSLPIHHALRIVTELARREPQSFGASSSLSIFEAHLPDADRMIQVQSAEQGIVLVIRPTAAGVGDLLNAQLPVEAVQFVDEKIGGDTRSAFVENGKLRYPDYPDVPSVVVAQDEFLIMKRTTDMVLQLISLQRGKPGLRLTLDGRLAEGAIGRPDPGSTADATRGVWFDPRLTVFQTVRYGPRWSAVAVLGAWVMSTGWLGYARWKKLRG